MQQEHASHLPPASAGARSADDPVGSAGDSVKLPLVEESVDIEKVVVDRGGYRLTKRVEVREERVEHDLQHQRVEIERRPVGQLLSELPPTRQEGDTLVVPVCEEVLVTEKRWRLVEEVRIRSIHGSTRKTEAVSLRSDTVEVERLEPE